MDGSKDIVRVAILSQDTEKRNAVIHWSKYRQLVEEFYSKLSPDKKKYYDDRREYEKICTTIEHTCLNGLLYQMI